MNLTFLLFLNFLTLIFADCPVGTIPTIKDKTLCYSFNSTSTDFLSAEEQCNSLGGHLTSVHNMLDNMFLNQQAVNRFTNSDASEFWFGANDLIIAGNWTWMDETPFDFTDWEKGQPQNVTGADCGAMILKSGIWKSDDCSKNKPFVCLIKALLPTIPPTTPQSTIPPTTKPKACTPTWTYASLTGFCYKIIGGKNWPDADIMCSALNSNLASIHSLEESLFIANLVIIVSPNINYTWIGGITADEEVDWIWTDRTPFDYIYWGQNRPAGQGNCLLLATNNNQHIGAFWEYNCSYVTNYACKKLPTD